MWAYTPIGWTDVAKDALLTTVNNNFDLVEGKKWSDLPSATTTDLSTIDGTFAFVTGTTTITWLWTLKAGISRQVKFTWILTLTHNATSLILPWWANITTAANDIAEFISLWSWNWLCTKYTRADWTPLSGWWGWGWAILSWVIAWTQTTWVVLTIPVNQTISATTFRISLWVQPSWSNFTVTLSKNGVTECTATITTVQSATNGLYQDTETVFTSGSYIWGDVLEVEITGVGSSVSGSDFSFNLT